MKFKYIALLGALFLLTCLSTQAADQTNRIAVDRTRKKPAWESSIAVGLTLTRGNSDSILTTGNLQTHKKMPRDEISLGADATYGETDSVKNNETAHGFGQYNHLFNERFYDFGRLDALHDGIADVVYRFTLSPGVGYYFVKRKLTTLAGEVGPSAVTEKLDGQADSYVGLRIAERFEHKFNEHARLWQNFEFLPQANKLNNFLINAEIGIESALTEKLSLRVVLQDSYANIPAPGRKDNDVKLVSGLAYKF